MFEFSFEVYLPEVKKLLCKNMTEEDRKVHICYEYNDEEVDEHKDYFNDCYNKHLSPYKALLYFYDHLYPFEERKIVDF